MLGYSQLITCWSFEREFFVPMNNSPQILLAPLYFDDGNYSLFWIVNTWFYIKFLYDPFPAYVFQSDLT